MVDKKTIILHKGRPVDNKLFDNIDIAKNYLSFKYSNTTFKKKENTFINARYGTHFEFIELENHN